MAYSFGDGFDLYPSVNDTINGVWDSGVFGGFNMQSGRFGGQALSFFSGGSLIVKSSNVNDAVHHVCLAYWTGGGALSGTTLANYVMFSDGATAQCAICFRSDGAIQLFSGSAFTTVLATWTGGVPSANTWYGFEFEVVIHPTAGSFAGRRNGSASNDFSATSLNTRGGTTNNYANRFTIGQNAGYNAQRFDDVFWRSDASGVAWMGDIRCYYRPPASDAVLSQLSRSTASGFPFVPQPITQDNNLGPGGNQVLYMPFVPLFSGTIGSVQLNFSVASTCNFKCAIFSVNAFGQPATALGTATPIAPPVVTGVATFTFPTPVPVTAGVTYCVATANDTGAAGRYYINGNASTFYWNGATYASFPQNNPTLTGTTTGIYVAVTVVITASPQVNWPFVAETGVPRITDYVYDTVVGHNDLYSIAPIVGIPLGHVAVITRAYVQKADAGTRTGAIQLKSGSAVVQTPAPTLSANSWTWLYRIDPVDFGTAVSTTWNPADLFNTTVSGGNLTATSTSSGNGGIRSIANQATGKYYWECLCTTWTGGNTCVGIGNALTALSSVAATAANACFVFNDGNVWANGTTPGPALGTRANGDVIGIAVDLTARLVWFRVAPAGNWNGSGTANPATGAGGVSFTLSGNVFALFAFQTASQVVTGNFGATTFTGTVPSGFTAGFTGFGPWTSSAVDALQVGPVIVT